MKKAMSEGLGDDADNMSKVLTREDIPRHLIKDALELVRQNGWFTIFSLVDALTRLTQASKYAGDRAELDLKVGRLLTLAA